MLIMFDNSIQRNTSTNSCGSEARDSIARRQPMLARVELRMARPAGQIGRHRLVPGLRRKTPARLRQKRDWGLSES